YLVVWQEYRGLFGGGYDISGARVTSEGVVADTNAIIISQRGADQIIPKVAASGSNYFVVWRDQRTFYDVYGARVTATGVVADTNGILISMAANAERAPAVAFNGTNYLVV